MKIKEFKKLEESVKDQSFNQNFKNINFVMFFLSIFGHLASIFLAYFLISNVLRGAIENNEILVTSASIILLFGLELLKREIFDKFSLQQIKFKSIFKSEVFPLFISSLIIVSMSFYASVKGADEFSSKSNQIDAFVDIQIDRFSDSLTRTSQKNILEIEEEIKKEKSQIEKKDQEQTNLESDKLTRQGRLRVKDLKLEKENLSSNIIKLENKIQEIKLEKENQIKNFENKIKGRTNKNKDENSKNSIIFVIMSTIIEITILAGVYFNEYYKWVSYKEFKEKLENDRGFNRWFNYNSALDVIYKDDTKINDKVPKLKTIKEILRINNINMLDRDMDEMLKLFNSIGITKTLGNTRYINKSKQVASDLLKDYFNVK